MAAVLFPSGCASSAPENPPALTLQSSAPLQGPELDFTVLSDTHVYDKALGTSGAAWDAYLAHDTKLLQDSEETLDVALARVVQEKPAFILIAGDLTKDGERQNHELLARKLANLRSLGIKSYVLPGNHDIENPHARRFLPSGGTEAVPSVSPDDFASIYKDCGYGEALYRDPNSLSYIASPAPGLWLLMLDSAKYERNAFLGKPEVSGRIREETYTWMAALLAEAQARGIRVIAAEHHPLLEHFAGMKSRNPDYIVDDNWKLASFLGNYGISIFFSGHYHASSIVRHSWGSSDGRLAGKSITDIETGSLVTWPCSFRQVRLTRDGSFDISTLRVEQLPSYAAAGKSFDVDGRHLIEAGFTKAATSAMKKLLIPQSDIDHLTPAICAALLAHYAGDAHCGSTQLLPTEGLSPQAQLVVAYYGEFLRGIWKLVPPKNVELMSDNFLIIHANGSWLATGKGTKSPAGAGSLN